MSTTPMKTKVNTPPSLSLTRTPQSHSTSSSSLKRGVSSAASGARPTTPTPTTPRPGAVTPPAAPAAQNISVGIRVRTFQKDENKELAVRMKDSTCEVHVPHRGRFPFSFDQCFWSNEVEDDQKAYSSQEEVFNRLGKPLVDNALDGFNSSIIAYGQTGSGKTYSIFGPKDSLGTPDEGLIPRVCNDIFERIRFPPSGVQYKVFVSVLEVYLEDAYDLLQKRKELKVRGDSQHGFSVVGLKSIQVNCYTEVLRLLGQADTYKTFAATAIHDRSSRAHTLFQLEVRTITAKTTRTARVVLADLAGCERIKAAQTESGVGFEQAKNINLSLLNLGTCIEAVVNRGKNGQSLTNIGEFRNSTLTKLLKDFIGGNSRTAMLVTIAPSIADVNNTIQALRFADRAKQIACHAVINSEINGAELQLKEEIAKVYEKKKELLDKECELDMQATMIKKKQAELEKKVYDVTEEKRSLATQLAAMTEEERHRLSQRETEIENRLKALQRELSESEQQREALDDRYLDMVVDQQSMQQDKDMISAEHARVLEEYEGYRNETAQQALFIQMEHAQIVANLEDRLKAAETDAKDSKANARSRADALAVDTSRRMDLLIREHNADTAAVSKDHAAALDSLRKKMMSLEEDLAVTSSSLAQKSEQCDLLGLAHSKARAQIVSQDERLAEQTVKAAEYEARIEQLDDRVLELSEGSTDKKHALENLKGELAAAKQAHEVATQNMTAAHTAELDRLNQKLKHREESLQQQLSFQERKNSELEANCQDIMEELTAVTRSVQQAEAETAGTREQLGESAAQLAHHKKAEEELRARVAKLTADLDAECSRHASTQRKLNATTASLDETEVQLNTLSQQLQADLAKEQHTSQTYRRKLLSSRNSYDVAYQQCVAAQNALSIVFQQHQQGESESTDSIGSHTSMSTPTPARAVQHCDPIAISPTPTEDFLKRQYTPSRGSSQHQHHQQQHQPLYSGGGVSGLRQVLDENHCTNTMVSSLSSCSQSPPSSPLKTVAYVG